LAQNPNFSKTLARFRAVGQFSVPETGDPVNGRNRLGCDRSPRFFIPNSHILWLTTPSG
jgi:hypothetical protein